MGLHLLSEMTISSKCIMILFETRLKPLFIKIVFWFSLDQQIDSSLLLCRLSASSYGCVQVLMDLSRSRCAGAFRRTDYALQPSGPDMVRFIERVWADGDGFSMLPRLVSSIKELVHSKCYSFAQNANWHLLAVWNGLIFTDGPRGQEHKYWQNNLLQFFTRLQTWL